VYGIDTFAVNCWSVAAASSSVSRGALLPMMLAGKPIVLFRNPDGQVVALEDRCVHRQAPLSLGRLEPRGLRCLYHGLLFGPDGRCLEIPGQDRIPPTFSVVSYPVLERYGWIWVWPGDATRADPAMLPGTIAGDHPEWITAQAHLDFSAHYTLITDNLLDFSHLSYVHEKSFRADPKWATVRPSIKSLPNGLRISRWIAGAPALMSARQMAGQMADTWQSYDFLAPGVLIMETFYCALGTAEASGFERPEAGILVRNCASQTVTATTQRTSRYFYAVALPVGETTQDACDKILEVSRSAFLEDKAIIEGQQQRIDLDPGRSPLPTTADGGIARFHRILRRLSGDNISADPGMGEIAEQIR
jgi:vanillate O-demethylase monooxygenase subunit